MNLKRREDRRANVIKEMEYIGWKNYEFFDAIDTNSITGCGLSHVALADKLLQSDDEYIIVLEDDVMFLPWSKQILHILEERLKTLEFDIIHFSPFAHRQLVEHDNHFLKLHNCPPLTPKERGIYGTTGFIYNRKVANIIKQWSPNHVIEAIDVFFDQHIYPVTKSYSPIYPLMSQGYDYSNITHNVSSNLYVLLYQWHFFAKQLPFGVKDLSMEFIRGKRDNNEPLITF